MKAYLGILNKKGPLLNKLYRISDYLFKKSLFLLFLVDKFTLECSNRQKVANF